MIRRWFSHFSAVKLPPKTEVLAIVDHDSEEFFQTVKDKLYKVFCYEKAPWGVRVAWTQRAPAPEWADIQQRRSRICGNWHTFLEHAQGKVILGAEDDTLPAYDAYLELVCHLEHARFAQATILGRWDAGYVPHWTAKERNGEVCEWKSAFFAGEDVVEIHGGGWYCFAAFKEDLKQVDFSPKEGPIGPDMWALHQMHKNGARCVGDWSIHCQHVCTEMTLSPNREVIDVVTYRKDGNRWRHTIGGGRGRIIDPENIQVCGSQPRPIGTRVQRVRVLKTYGSKPPELSEEWAQV